MSAEAREKMSKTRIERGCFKGAKNPAARPVVALDKNTKKFVGEYEWAAMAHRNGTLHFNEEHESCGPYELFVKH